MRDPTRASRGTPAPVNGRTIHAPANENSLALSAGVTWLLGMMLLVAGSTVATQVRADEPTFALAARRHTPWKDTEVPPTFLRTGSMVIPPSTRQCRCRTTRETGNHGSVRRLSPRDPRSR